MNKINPKFLADHCNVDKDSIDFMEHKETVRKGDNEHYKNMVSYIRAHDMADAQHYAWVKKKMDIANFIDFQVAQIYCDNTDAGGNIRYWRPKRPGGKWRWILYDTDWGFGLHNKKAYSRNSLAFFTDPNGPEWPNPEWSTLLLRSLLNNKEFQEQFINRMCDRLNTDFATEHVKMYIKHFTNVLTPEMDRHLTRWKLGADEWSQSIDNMYVFAEKRPEYLYYFMHEQFKTGELADLQLESSVGGSIRLNGSNIEVDAGKAFRGKYFENVPVQLEAVPEFGYKFVGWEGTTVKERHVAVNLKSGKVLQLKAIFETYNHPLLEQVIINEVCAYNKHTGDWLEIHNKSGEAIDLSGWNLKDDKHIFTFEKGIVPADGYLVVCEDMEAFTKAYPEVKNVVDGLNFGLDKSMEQLSLFTYDGAAVDSISYAVEPLASESVVVVKILKPETNHIIAQEEARILGNDTLQIIHQYKLKSIVVRSIAETNRAYQVVEGMALGSYQFLKYFSKPTAKENTLRTIKVESSTLDAPTVQELSTLVEAVFLSRTLVNEPFSFLDTPQLSKEIEKMANDAGFDFEFLNKEKIQALKMGGILAVNQASNIPPHFNILEWKPANATNEKPIVLVGKGVVYDTGGLSLKPSEGMEYMKCDMGGAATVAGTLYVAAKNKLPLHIIGLIPATDNKIGTNAIAPGDVIRMYSGTTVEVLNTDAEGRLILADALHYAKKYNPMLVIDFATLTGAAVRALGTYGSLYFSTAAEKIKSNIEKSGMETYERLAELPLWREYDDDLKSNVADLKNLGGVAAGITCGDINGVGPEVIIKTLLSKPQPGGKNCVYVVYGNPKMIAYHKNFITQENININTITSPEQAQPNAINVINCWDDAITFTIGEATQIAGKCATAALDAATKDIKAGKLTAIVTAPINKKSMQMSGFTFPGHTEYFAHHFGVKDNLMMLVSEDLKVGLVTNHLALKDVSAAITKEKILHKIQMMNKTLKMDFNIDRPLIAVLGLNPHAGDQGAIGQEETNIIIPALKAAKNEGILAYGPFPADGFFGSSQFRKFDGIIAMYHDQGLGPFKAISFGAGVNYTAGMPIVRTSPDHGTAYDIAGKGEADERSLMRAIFAAIDIANNRFEYNDMREEPIKRTKLKILDDETGKDEYIEEMIPE
ncbi:unnamed protein product, partial [Darwinula stevensoni]